MVTGPKDYRRWRKCAARWRRLIVEQFEPRFLLNSAPSGRDHAVTIKENSYARFNFTDFGFSDDSDRNNPLAIKFTTLPDHGALFDNGIKISAGQLVPTAEFLPFLSIGVRFYPATDESGVPYTSFNFQVQDDGGTANGGVDLDPYPKTMTILVKPPNHPPSGQSKTITILEDSPYTFSAADFGFKDALDPIPNALKSVYITALPTAGDLIFHSAPLRTPFSVPLSELGYESLGYLPPPNSSGVSIASFGFEVQDDGGTANGGIDTDPIPQSITITVIPVNDPPAGVDKLVTTLEDTAYTFSPADFGFSDLKDASSNAFVGTQIDSLPAAGILTNNGSAIVAGQFIAIADIAGSGLVFMPAANANGSAYAQFAFQVKDDGGTFNGGIDLDPTRRTMTIGVAPVNDPPRGSSRVLKVLPSTNYTFYLSDFGYTDPNDQPPNPLAGVKVATLPASGTILLNGVAVSAGFFVSATEIAAGHLIFSSPSFKGTSAFDFQVQDTGGTTTGGVDLDLAKETIVLYSVQGSLFAPTGADVSLNTFEDTPYTFGLADFPFSDADNNNLRAAKLTTLPDKGLISDNGTPVQVGQFISAYDIGIGWLTYTPPPLSFGNALTTFNFQVQDDGGVVGGGDDFDRVPRTTTINVVPVNHAPTGSSKSIQFLIPASYVLGFSDFNFSDAYDAPANSFKAIKFSTVPATGLLTDNSVPVTEGQIVSAEDIAGGLLIYQRSNLGFQFPFPSFTFQVQDDGGTANGGIDLDPSPETITLAAFYPSQWFVPPVTIDKTITALEDAPSILGTSDFDASWLTGYFSGVQITRLPAQGLLMLRGVPVAVNQVVTASDIYAQLLQFLPAPNVTGIGYSSFTFRAVYFANELWPDVHTVTVNVASVNDPPTASDGSVRVDIIKNRSFVLSDFGFSDPIDSPENDLAAIILRSLPTFGSLTLNGSAITALPATISAADILNGNFKYVPSRSGFGFGSTTFGFQVMDNGGTANGGIDTDPMTRAMTVEIDDGINTLPQGRDHSVNALEDTAYALRVTDFPFTDTTFDMLRAVKVTTLPTAGILLDNGNPVVVGQFVSAYDIGVGRFTFLPPANVNGTATATFMFQVQDSGGTAIVNGVSLIDLDPISHTQTINVKSVNDAPSGTSHNVRVLGGVPRTLAMSDFGFSDANDVVANNLLAVKIDSLLYAGMLTDGGYLVTPGQWVSASDLVSAKVVFTPDGSPIPNTITFQVKDDGGTVDGGIDFDPSPKTLSLIAEPNRPPLGIDNSVTVLEDHTYALSMSDIFYSDAYNYFPADNFTGIRIASLPASGVLAIYDQPAAVGDFIDAASLAAYKLTFTPTLDQAGYGIAQFSYQLKDDGGTANGGIDLTPTPITIKISVTPINDPPMFVKGDDSSGTDENSTTHGPALPVVVPGWATQISTGPATATEEVGQKLYFSVSLSQADSLLFTATGQPAVDPTTGDLTFTVAPNANGTAHASVMLQDDGGTANGGVDTSGAQMFDIVITKPFIWHNTKDALDVSGHMCPPDEICPFIPGLDVDDDGHISPFDALNIINYINAFGTYLDGHVPTLGSTIPGTVFVVDIAKPFDYIDVNCDDFVTAADALAVINVINTGQAGGEGEGKPASDEDDLMTLLAEDIALQTKRRR